LAKQQTVEFDYRWNDETPCKIQRFQELQDHPVLRERPTNSRVPMNAIKLKKVETAALEILQIEIGEYIKTVRISEEFFTAIILVDVSLRIWLLLRKKIESGNQRHSLTLKPQEAAAIVKCCLQSYPTDRYTANALLQFKNELDQQLKSL
jgi:serine/threonine protein kinase